MENKGTLLDRITQVRDHIASCKSNLANGESMLQYLEKEAKVMGYCKKWEPNGKRYCRLNSYGGTDTYYYNTSNSTCNWDIRSGNYSETVVGMSKHRHYLIAKEAIERKAYELNGGVDAFPTSRRGCSYMIKKSFTSGLEVVSTAMLLPDTIYLVNSSAAADLIYCIANKTWEDYFKGQIKLGD